MEFLTELVESGLSYSAVNTARSAISAVFLSKGDREKIGSNPIISRFMKGVFELRTPLPRHKEIWDVNILLKHISDMPENHKLDLKSLTKKLCALLMLTTAQRVQTLHVFKLSCIKMNSAGCTIKIVDKLKHTRQGNHQDALELSKFPEGKICVIQ